MKTYFYIRYTTAYGETLWISGNTEALGHNEESNAYPMECLNDELWMAELEMSPKEVSRLKYKYILQNAAGERTGEWRNDRSASMLRDDAEEIRFLDTWNNAGDIGNAFYTSPFRDVLLFRAAPAELRPPEGKYTHVFKVKCPLTSSDEVVCLSGSGEVLGEWNKENPLLLELEGDWWVIGLNLRHSPFPVAYKYGIYNLKEKKFVRFEDGDNRLLHSDSANRKLTVLHDGFVQVPNNTWKGAGVAIPVFSLRSRKSFGVGEFADIRLLVDWAHKTGLRMIQVLPVNDTTATHSWVDSYPYAAISAFALHPIYVNLEKVAGKKHAGKFSLLRKKQGDLNGQDTVQYDEVLRFKLNLMRELYEEEKDVCFADESYQAFFKGNRHWLVPYAAFCYLRDRYSTAHFEEWEDYSKYNKEAIEQLAGTSDAAHDAVHLQYFIQYHLHLQLQDAVDYAHRKGIVIKGDIPIGVYRYSCDTWVQPELYHMDQQAGAPPDDFAIKGQNWGFPTYNWHKMQEDHFSWWRRRFEQMSHYFDAFRIDHILGFFRIWSIPMESVEGIMGTFDPAIAVDIAEMGERGIWFEYNRYCRPWITDQVVADVFGDKAGMVKEHFLEQIPGDHYQLREEYGTQRKIDTYFRNRPEDDENERLRYGLFDLLSNVIFFEQEGSDGNKFHFRIGMQGTKSFQYLDGHTQHRLRELYNDYYFRRQDHFWMQEAMHKLPPLKRATNMLICGEDLGMVPHCVPEVMKKLGILSLEIQRMPKNPDTEFFHPNDAPYLSVITPSTHDMSTVRGWWEEDRGKTQRFYNQVLRQHGDIPYYCEAWVCRAIVLQHLYSPAMWSIFLFQDLIGMSETLRRENPHEERINVPANAKNYWRYRMHLYLEDLVQEKEFNEELREYVLNSGRG